MTQPFEDPDGEVPGGDEQRFSLVMPFVVVHSTGGPYDDDAFAAGWQCGSIDRALAVAQAANAQTVHVKMVRSAVTRQLELIGMHRGYGFTHADISAQWPQWCEYTFSTQPIGQLLSTEEPGGPS